MFDFNVEHGEIIKLDRTIPLVILKPKESAGPAPGILWIHGGGYVYGMKEMVYVSRAAQLVEKYGVTVVSPGYRTALMSPYPAAIDDCYDALLWLRENADELDVLSDKIMVGGESAGGGLAAALCMMARDRGEVNVAYQMPLYPMLDNFDTESSKDNHGKNWDTKRNHLAWKVYLREHAKEKVSPYASPSRQNDYEGLPPCYTFVGDGEPFYSETLKYVEDLKAAGVEASVDVYHTDLHGFDVMAPTLEISREAAEKFNLHFEYALEHYSAKQPEKQGTDTRHKKVKGRPRRGNTGDSDID